LENYPVGFFIFTIVLLEGSGAIGYYSFWKSEDGNVII
jgi:hypothetical protein